MADIVDRDTRSRMMAGIRSRNTRPELMIRCGLHGRGFRFRIHARLPGSPDLAFAKYRCVIFVNGCFWHGHNCRLFKLPKTRTAFWQEKIERNKLRDLEAIDHLDSAGWRSLVVWECAMRGAGRIPECELLDTISNWLTYSEPNHLELYGEQDGTSRSHRLDG